MKLNALTVGLESVWMGLFVMIIFCVEPGSASDEQPRCEFDRELLDHLNRRDMLNPSPGEAPPLQMKYSEFWNYNNTCWLAEQLLVTEALGGHHPFCNNHAQNRNLLYLLNTRAGSMKPATEAVQQMGHLLRRHNFSDITMGESYQMAKLFPNAALVQAEKDRTLKELREKGLSVLPRSMSSDWVDGLTDDLKDKDFLEMAHGWTLKGLTPEVARDKQYYGTFMLHDLNQGLELAKVQQIAYDPFILDVLQDLLGAPPVIRTVDVFMNVAREDGNTTKFSFDTWHKDFNSARSVKVFVYLTDATDPKLGPHTYIPYTQNVMGPSRRTRKRVPGYTQLIEEYALSMASQVLPEDYLKQNIFTQQQETLFGNAGTVWIEDTHVFHRAEKNLEGWRGLLQIDYTATGYCGKDHASLHKPLSRIPTGSRTQEALRLFPRLFQRARVGEYARPNKEILEAPITESVLPKAKPMESHFGSTLLYNKTMQVNDPTDHTGYIQAGFRKAGKWHYSKDEFPKVPCWEYECQLCLRSIDMGNCSVCSQLFSCTCSCEHLFTCDDVDSKTTTKDTTEWHEFPVNVSNAPSFTSDGSSSKLIPRVISQFWYSLDPIPDGSDKAYQQTHLMMEKWKSLDGYDYKVFDNESARSFLAQHFPSIVLEAYDTLIPGAFKSDLFRYACLLINGGVYVDNDVHYSGEGELELEQLLHRDEIGLLATVDQSARIEREGIRSSCLLSGLIATYPGHPAIAIALSRIVSQVLNRDTLPDLMNNLCPDPQTSTGLALGHLYLTGPCLFGSALNIALGRSPFSEFAPGDISVTGVERFPIMGDIRLLQFDFVPCDKSQHTLSVSVASLLHCQNHRVMRRIHVGPHGNAAEITWSKITTETPRTKDNRHYGELTGMVPRIHMYSRGVYKENNDTRDTKRALWYDFAVFTKDSPWLPYYSTAIAPGRHGRLKRPAPVIARQLMYSNGALEMDQADEWQALLLLQELGLLCLVFLRSFRSLKRCQRQFRRTRRKC